MQFLIWLNDTFSQARSQLLLTTTLLDVEGANSLLLQDEAQRAYSHPPLVSKRAALQAQGLPTAFVPRSQPPDVSSQALLARHQGSTRMCPRCTHCGILGHTQDKCYHGYPSGHKYYRKGNTHGQPSTSSTVVATSQTTAAPKDSLTSLQQLLHLLREVNQPRANLAGESIALYSALCLPHEWVIENGATDHVSFTPSGFHTSPSPPSYSSTIFYLMVTLFPSMELVLFMLLSPILCLMYCWYFLLSLTLCQYQNLDF